MWKYLLPFLFFLRALSAGSPAKYWVDTDYLLWFIKKNPVPIPLVTSGSYKDPLPGAIGQPHTHTVLGKRSIDMGWMQGFQVDSGVWIKHNIGLEGSYFLLPTVSQSKSLRTSGLPGSPNYPVPIFDVSGVFGLNGTPGETIFILPGPIAGDPGFSATYKLHLHSRLQGAELNSLYRILNKRRFQLDCAGGMYWLQLHEKLIFKANSMSVPSFLFGEGFYNTKDRFETDNNFLAAQLKLDTCYQTKRWNAKASFKSALGAVLEEVKIKGFSQTSSGNAFFLTQGTRNKILPGGIFAEPSNRGTHTKNPLACGFEIKMQTGFKITKHVEIHLGYTFLWINKVVRPGNQIDRKINATDTALAAASRDTVGVGSPDPVSLTGLPGSAPAPSGPRRPRVPFKTTPFWAQGLNAGIQLSF